MSKETEHIDIPNKLYFRIGEVADIVGVDSHVLRYWEKEMGMSPHRSIPDSVCIAKLTCLFQRSNISFTLKAIRLAEQNKPCKPTTTTPFTQHN